MQQQGTLQGVPDAPQQRQPSHPFGWADWEAGCIWGDVQTMNESSYQGPSKSWNGSRKLLLSLEDWSELQQLHRLHASHLAAPQGKTPTLRVKQQASPRAAQQPSGLPQEQR